AAALLGAGQFGLGAAVAPLVGVLGNDELALAAVMTGSSVIAFLALLAVGVSPSDGTTTNDEVVAPSVLLDPA
ncbi:MAG: Bcr/CflA family drug resistance efflux transporter, partial [Actinomycetota bacterium]|nr:Bcr/CflA family drug resistance efflux transporter [Actinomycetota bacterium]